MKNVIKFLGVFSVLAVLLPSMVSAQSVADLQAQIQALLAQLQQLQAQLAQVQGGVTAQWCHTFNTNLKVDDSGAEVQALQKALNLENIIPSAFEGLSGKPDQSTFDEETASYVSAFQEKYRSEILDPAGLKSPTGYVGARTRAKLNALYGCGVVSPKPGPEPVPEPGPEPVPVPEFSSITVLSPNGGETWAKGTTQTIKWQDNLSYPAVCVDEKCTPPAPRFYDITLNPYYAPCTGTICPMYPYRAPYTIVKNIDVSSYNWVVGTYETSYTAPDGPYTIQICQSGTFTCDSSDSYFKIVSGTTSNQPPVITGVSGPTSLKLYEVGTWTVKAYDPDGTVMSYSVDWGDGGAMGGLTMSSSQTAISQTQTATFTHSYSKGGLYKVVFNAVDDRGVSAQSSITVAVGQTSAAPSITVLSPNGGETWIAGLWQQINWKTSNYPANTPVNIYLLKKSIINGINTYDVVSTVAVNTSNDGNEMWLMPTSIQPGDQYLIQVGCPSDSFPLGCTGDESDAPFTIVSPPSSPSSLTVLSPNGGEVWVRNSDVDASYGCSIMNCQKVDWNGGSSVVLEGVNIYLEQKLSTGEFKTMGKIMAASYGSTVTYGSIFWQVGIVVPTSCNGPWLYQCSGWVAVDPGQYYVRIVDKTTGSWDRSNAPFTIVSGTTSATAITVSTDPSTPLAQRLVMGSVGNQLTTFRFTETSNTESVKITDLVVNQNTTASKPGFYNLVIRSGSTLVGTAGSAVPTTNGYIYKFHFANPVVVSQANSVSLALNGDVASYASSGTIDNSQHVFSVASGDVTAVGVNSNTPTAVSGSASGNPMTVLRTKLTVSATPIGVTSGRAKQSVDDFGSIIFTANPNGAVQVNSVKITFSGSAIDKNYFYNTFGATVCFACSVKMYDPATGTSYDPIPDSTDMTNMTIAFDLGNPIVAAGLSKSFTLRINDLSAFPSAASGVSQTFSATIKAASDVVWKDGLDSAAIGGLNLQLNAVPIQINAVLYGGTTVGFDSADYLQMASVLESARFILENMQALVRVLSWYDNEMGYVATLIKHVQAAAKFI